MTKAMIRIRVMVVFGTCIDLKTFRRKESVKCQPAACISGCFKESEIAHGLIKAFSQKPD
jgi:hypothetical protein